MTKNCLPPLPDIDRPVASLPDLPDPIPTPITCFSLCKSCNYSGNEEYNNCTSCVSGFKLDISSGNCLKEVCHEFCDTCYGEPNGPDQNWI